MSQPTPESVKQQFRALVAANVSKRAAAKAVGISSATGLRILAEPFDGSPQGPPNAPPPNYHTDQQRPAPDPFVFRPGYHDHTFRSFAEPIAFDGFTLTRARSAVSLHRQGMFLESYALCIAILGFGPILAALTQRMSPGLSLPRRIVGGTSNLSKLVASEVEAQLVPADGLLPSSYFPPTLWGSMICWKALMGFAVLQHALGEPDPDTGVRAMYTRLWPNWAVQRIPGRRTFQAIVNDGPPVDILNDGKFTLIADQDDPHYFGAIVALAEEAVDGKQTQRARASYIKAYGNPKWYAIGPPGAQTHGPEGDALFNSAAIMRHPDAFGVFPYGSKIGLEGLTSSQSSTFKDGLDSNLFMAALILLGQDGTTSSGSGGVYSSPVFGRVLHSIVKRDLVCAVRGANQGHVAPFVQCNYAGSIAEDPDWRAPVLEIPLPDPDADARIASKADRRAKWSAQITADRLAGAEVDQDHSDTIADDLEIKRPRLALTVSTGAQSFGYDQENGVITINQRLEELGKPLDTTGRGVLTVPAYRALLARENAAAKADAEAEADVKVENATGDESSPVEPVSNGSDTAG